MIIFRLEKFCNERALEVLEQYGEKSGFVRLFVANVWAEEAAAGCRSYGRFVDMMFYLT
jgi:hypothetical protein